MARVCDQRLVLEIRSLHVEAPFLLLLMILTLLLVLTLLLILTLFSIITRFFSCPSQVGVARGCCQQEECARSGQAQGAQKVRPWLQAFPVRFPSLSASPLLNAGVEAESSNLLIC